MLIKVPRTSPQHSPETVESVIEKHRIWKRNTKRKVYIPRKKTVNYWQAEIFLIIQYNRILKEVDLLSNAPNQLSKFRTKNCGEINYDTRGTYNTNS